MVGGTHQWYPRYWGYRECVGGTTLPPTVPPKMGGIGGTVFHDWGYCLKSKKGEYPQEWGVLIRVLGVVLKNRIFYSAIPRVPLGFPLPPAGSRPGNP